MSVELFRYRGAAKDGGTLAYVFEAGEQNSPNAVTKEKAAEIAADFMTTFYHGQVRSHFGSCAFRTRLKDQSRICFSSFSCPMGRLLSRGGRSGCSRVQGCLKRCKIRATVTPCQTKKTKCLSIYGAIFWKGN